jgi:hypothetical protein
MDGEKEERKMGCWAVPSVAADIWGISIQEVLKAVQEGRVLSRHDNGLLVVDLEPAGMTASRRREDRRPRTYSPAPPVLRPVPETCGDPATESRFGFARRHSTLVRRAPAASGRAG